MQRVMTTTVCDFPHGTEEDAERTVAFGFNGRAMEIDCCRQHLHMFEEAIGPYQGAARTLSLHPPARRRRRTAADRKRAAQVRSWAREAGIQISSHGRIRAAVEKAYEAAQAAPGSARRTDRCTEPSG